MSMFPTIVTLFGSESTLLNKVTITFFGTPGLNLKRSASRVVVGLGVAMFGDPLILFCNLYGLSYVRRLLSPKSRPSLLVVISVLHWL